MIYLASPYSHDDPAVRYHRFCLACHAAARLIQDGPAAFSPITHSHPIAGAGKLPPCDLDLWMRSDAKILPICDSMKILAIDGWRQSKEILAEIRLAVQHGIPISLMWLGSCNRRRREADNAFLDTCIMLAGDVHVAA